jgi:hypothetical protein
VEQLTATEADIKLVTEQSCDVPVGKAIFYPVIKGSPLYFFCADARHAVNTRKLAAAVIEPDSSSIENGINDLIGPCGRPDTTGNMDNRASTVCPNYNTYAWSSCDQRYILKRPINESV